MFKLFLISNRYKQSPNSEELVILEQKFGIGWDELKDGFVADESIYVIREAFGNDAKFTPSNFHNKSDTEKLLKDKQQQSKFLYQDFLMSFLCAEIVLYDFSAEGITAYRSHVL